MIFHSYVKLPEGTTDTQEASDIPMAHVNHCILAATVVRTGSTYHSIKNSWVLVKVALKISISSITSTKLNVANVLLGQVF